MIGLRGGRVVGTPLPDTLEKYWGEPVVVTAGAGDDVIDVVAGGRDVVSCGAGRDRVRADRMDVVAKDCEVVVR